MLLSTSSLTSNGPCCSTLCCRRRSYPKATPFFGGEQTPLSMPMMPKFPSVPEISSQFWRPRSPASHVVSDTSSLLSDSLSVGSPLSSFSDSFLNQEFPAAPAAPLVDLTTDFLLKSLDELIASSSASITLPTAAATNLSVDSFPPELYLMASSPALIRTSTPTIMQASSNTPRPQSSKGDRRKKCCSNCFAETSAVWRMSKFPEPSATVQLVCNACGLYEKRTGKRRPINLQIKRQFDQLF